VALGEVLEVPVTAVLALVCEAPLDAGLLCAHTGELKLAASKIAAIDPGAANCFVTLIPVSL
jgi:hypothetical protein